MTLYKSKKNILKSDEDTSQEEDEGSPRVSLGREKFKIKKKFKPIYRNLGLEPLVIEDMLISK